MENPLSAYARRHTTAESLYLQSLNVTWLKPTLGSLWSG